MAGVGTNIARILAMGAVVRAARDRPKNAREPHAAIAPSRGRLLAIVAASDPDRANIDERTSADCLTPRPLRVIRACDHKRKKKE